MASGPIISRQIDRETMATVADFYFLGLQNHCRWWSSHEIKRCSLLERKAMTNPDSILKSRDITLPTKIYLVKAMFFSVVRYGCESWAIKKAKCQRIYIFWTVVLEKTLESSLDCKEIKPVNPKGNQSWIFIGRTGDEAEAPVLWPSDAKNRLERPWCWVFEGRGEGDDRGWSGWMATSTRWTWVWASSGSWWWTGKPGVLQSMGLQRVRHNWATELNWTGQFIILKVERRHLVHRNNHWNFI